MAGDQDQIRRRWLPKVREEKLHFSEAPARMAIAVALGWSGKGVMLLSPAAGSLFFIPLAVGATSLGLSGLLLTSGPAKIVICRQSGTVKHRRRGIRLPGKSSQPLHMFDKIELVEVPPTGGGITGRLKTAMKRLLARGATPHDRHWEVRLSSSQDGVKTIVFRGFGHDRITAEATARSVAEFTGLPFEPEPTPTKQIGREARVA